jgi:hypothetical protein
MYIHTYVFMNIYVYINIYINTHLAKYCRIYIDEFENNIKYITCIRILIKFFKLLYHYLHIGVTCQFYKLEHVFHCFVLENLLNRVKCKEVKWGCSN